MMNQTLIIPEKPLVILPSLATKIGLNEAIVLQQIHYWLQTKPHIIDNKKWVYNTLKKWQENFPFWSIRTIQRTLKRLEDMGLIESRKINQQKHDQTKWYTINYDKLPKIEMSNRAEGYGQNGILDDDNLSKSMMTNCPNLNNINNITETTTETTTENIYKNKNIVHFENAHVFEGEKEERETVSGPPEIKYSQAFLKFWAVYPVKKGKAVAYKKWKQMKLDPLVDEIIRKVKEFRAKDRRWREGYIPHASTFINQRRWEDEIEIAPDLDEVRIQEWNPEKEEEWREKMEKLILAQRKRNAG